MKLSDSQVADLRRLAAEGRSPGELAAEFDISRRHAARLARGESRPALAATPAARPGPVSRALADFLAGLDKLDTADRVSAATATAVARALDDAASLRTAAALTAMPRLAATLVEIVAALAPADEDAEARVRRMLAPLDPRMN